MNKVILVGHLGADPEIRYTADGTCVAKMSLATNRGYTNAAGERVERTDWHRLTAWRKTAEVAGKFLTKGRMIGIEGHLEYGSYEKDGVTHYTTDIQVEKLEFLGSKGNGQTATEDEAPEAGSEGADAAAEAPADNPF